MNVKSVAFAIVLSGLCLIPLAVSGQSVQQSSTLRVMPVNEFGQDALLDHSSYRVTLRSEQEELAKNLAKALKSKDQAEILGALRLIAYAGDESYDRDVAKHLKSKHEKIAEQALDTLIRLASKKGVKDIYKEWTRLAKKEPDMLPALAAKLASMPATSDMVDNLLGFAKNKRISDDMRDHALKVSHALLEKAGNTTNFVDAASGLDALKALKTRFELRGQDHKHSSHYATLLLPGSYYGHQDYHYVEKNLVIPQGKGIKVDLSSFIRSDEKKGISFHFNALLEGDKDAIAEILIYYIDVDSCVQVKLTAEELLSSGTRWERPLIGKWINIKHDFMPFEHKLLNNGSITIDSSFSCSGDLGSSWLNMETPSPTYMTITVGKGSLTVSPGELTEIGMLP